MSRASPFPTSSSRRAPSPSLTNGNSSQYPYNSSTKPLQITRPLSRPNTPGDSSMITTSRTGINPSSIGPSRPQRSELRSRQVSEYSNSGASSSSRPTWLKDNDRDSGNEMWSDTPQSYRQRTSSAMSQTGSSRTKPERSWTGATDDSMQSPVALPAVLSAFQSAGARKRAMTNGSQQMEYERERQKEVETHKIRQQRIQEKAPGRRTNGRARTGDIDGEIIPQSKIFLSLLSTILCCITAVLDQIKDEWEFVNDPDVRRLFCL
jgi:exocyst complex component 4